jgi:hypothetical protein
MNCLKTAVHTHDVWMRSIRRLAFAAQGGQCCHRVEEARRLSCAPQAIARAWCCCLIALCFVEMNSDAVELPDACGKTKISL